jgi:hypothetical protein
LILLGGLGFIVMRKNADAVEDAVNPERALPVAFDVWGKEFTMREARELGKTSEGRAMLEPANGAVAITPEMLKLGRETFYQQSFGNEIPLTEVLGLLDGPLTAADFAVAIAELGGKGTTNLRVRLSRNANGRRKEVSQKAW